MTEPNPAGKPRTRAVLEGSIWSAGVLLVAALVVLLNYFGMKYYHRFDWTGTKIYSLSEKTRSLVGALDRDVSIHVLLQPSSNLFDPARELLERYAAASPRINLRFVDPEKNLVEAQRLVDQYRLSDLSVVVFESGDERRVVDTSKLADWDYSGLQFGAQPTMTGFRGEEAFTGALIELVEERKPRVLFTSGHGERSIDDSAPAGLSAVRDLLGGENVDLESWSSLGQPEVPAGTDLLVVAGPKVAFLAPEVEALERFVEGGGRMLLMLDPQLDAGGGLVETGLEIWLARRGVELGRDVVVDPSSTLPFYTAETIFVRAAGAHPIVESLGQAQYPVIVALARSVRTVATPDRFDARPLLETTSEGWGETELGRLSAIEKGEADIAGPVSIAVAVSVDATPSPIDEEELTSESDAPPPAPVGDGPRWRLVVIGDSDFAANDQVSSAGNPTLVSNAFNWLLERQNLLGIGPKTPEQVRLNLTPGQLSTITWLSLLVLPGLAVAAGVAVWSRRRR